MNDRSQESRTAQQLAEARYGFFAIWVTLAMLGILLLATGLLGFEAIGLMLPLPVALVVLVKNSINTNKRREEQAKAFHMKKNDNRREDV